MRMLIIIITLLFCHLGQSQNSFVNFKIETVESRTIAETEGILKSFKSLDFPIEELNQYLKRGDEFSNIRLMIDGHKPLDMVIYPYDMRSDDYIASMITEKDLVALEKAPNCTYRGYIDDISKGPVRLTITDDFINAQFSTEGEMHYFEAAKNYNRSASVNEVLYYSDSQVDSGHVGHCGASEVVSTDAISEAVVASSNRTNNCYAARLAIAVDHSMIEDVVHNSVAASINHTLAVMNNVDVNYALSSGNNFQDGIEFKIVTHLVSGCASCDPWTNSTNLNQVLTNLYIWGSNGGFITDFDIAQLWTDRDFDGQSVGLAHQGSNLVCADAAFHVLQDWTSNIPLLRTMTSHEIAHNLNSTHVGGSGMIMSSVVSNTMSWAGATKTKVNLELTNYIPSCVDICTSSFAPCDEIMNPAISNITDTGFDVSWDAIGGASVDVVIKDMEGTIITTTSTTASSATFTPSGFTACRVYYISLVNDCGAEKSAYREILFESPNEDGCADFEIGQAVMWSGQNIPFTDKSVNATTWMWDFGDGNTSTSQNPTHAYGSAGVYDVQLTVNGGTDTKVFPGLIKVLPNRSLPYTSAQGGDFDVNVNDFAADKIEGDFSLFERGVATGYLSSTSNVWKTKLSSDIGNQENESVLYTPRFNLANPGSYTISFDMGMELIFCNAPGAAQMQYSLDDGSSWTRLGSYGDSGPGISNWYTSGPDASCPLSSLIFADQTGWAFVGNNNSKSYDISFLSGNPSVIFRFVYSVSSSFAGGYNIDGILLDNFAIDAVFQTLPIDDLEFDIALNKDVVDIQWTNTGESQIATYSLEKSYDGSNFDFVTKTNAKGNHILNEYAYTDAELEVGFIYYRLMVTSTDGKVEYSNIKSIRYMNRGDSEIKIFPNPVNEDVIRVKLEGDYAMITYRIYNATGQLLLENKDVSLEEGNNFQISLLDIPNGVLFLELLDNSKSIYTERVIKL